MKYIFKLIFYILVSFTVLFSSFIYAKNTVNIPILCYHNLNPTVKGSMNITPKKFEEQLKWLKNNGFTIIPLKQAVKYLNGEIKSLPKKSIVITADDGWQSVYKYMYPIAKKYNTPITLFIYPQTISNGKNAMTWEELKKLQQSKLFDIQSHTYGHPNFKKNKRRLSADKYKNFVNKELTNSKKILEEKLDTKITLLAWPFGIYNKFLEQEAANAGYKTAFSIDAKPANKKYNPMSQPRYMIIDGQSMKTFARIANTASS